MKRVAFVSICAVTVLSLTTGRSLALEVQVTAVEASYEGPSDPRLIQLRPRLRRLVGYRAFRVIQEEKRNCPWRSPAAFALPGGRRVQIMPKGMRADEVLMQVRVINGPRALVDTDLRLQNRGVMLIGVDDDVQNPGILLIMLRAEE
jgi:hypothetical protein